MALPEYPTLKKSLEDLFMEVYKASMKSQMSVFRESPRFIQHEGARHTYTTVDGQHKEMDFQEVSLEIVLSKSELKESGIGFVLNLLAKKGEESGAKQAQYHFGQINAITTETGNTVRGELSVDTMLQVLERLHISFDDTGNPRMPTMVVHPDMAPQVESLAEAAEDPEVKTRLNEIFEQKRVEWNEEQSRRKLVD